MRKWVRYPGQPNCTHRSDVPVRPEVLQAPLLIGTAERAAKGPDIDAEPEPEHGEAGGKGGVENFGDFIGTPWSASEEFRIPPLLMPELRRQQERAVLVMEAALRPAEDAEA